MGYREENWWILSKETDFTVGRVTFFNYKIIDTSNNLKFMKGWDYDTMFDYCMNNGLVAEAFRY